MQKTNTDLAQVIAKDASKDPICNVDCVNENEKDNIDLLKINNFHTNYVKQFNTFARKTAESTLEMCRVVSMAKLTLSKADFPKFCNEIGQKETDSTIRKYLAIGDVYDKFFQ